ncbi:YwmB family TATA-box binding protein [Paenibacillus sp. HN-1]|uniref:YwmB family TATA-box binding protein n=1 Tax=Paenibacillus TaxID=44249 RepID=UPI001CA85746|nr:MULTISPECIES: YwmB family TATA-box binding protein [Paenibacillus]MBY9077371.1 YwmB family TATA-box binding protein [Paenibacillus sp. CGMCC 1.18879]MBY9085616.1 YwmB family TATA-box binding protein [Paenibacillus sinensis]
MTVTARWGRVILLLACCCVITAALAGFGGSLRNEAEASGAERRAEVQRAGSGEPAETLTRLAVIANRLTEPGSKVRVVLKWQGETETAQAEGASATAKLAEDLGLSHPAPADMEGHAAYRAAGESGGVQIKTLETALDDGSSYVIVTLETADLAATEAAFRAGADAAGAALARAGIMADWNVSMQGTAPGQGDPQSALALAQRGIAAALPGLKAEESYVDAATASLSYSVPGLGRSIRSGDHLLGVQAAVHHDGIRDVNRVTIGFPLITIEY